MLQGSLDNFGLHEVLGLLTDTAKTGRMRITGDRGSGSLWLAEGKLVGSEASRVDRAVSIEETMFELLRFESGNFSFNVDESPSTAADARSVREVLDAAQHRLALWREIEAVVPSLAHVVAPVALLPVPEITVSADEWELLMFISTGVEVGEVCDRFELGEVEGSRRVKLLIERHLIDITPPSTSSVADQPQDASWTAPPMPSAASAIVTPPASASVEVFDSPLEPEADAVSSDAVSSESPLADAQLNDAQFDVAQFDDTAFADSPFADSPFAENSFADAAATDAAVSHAQPDHVHSGDSPLSSGYFADASEGVPLQRRQTDRVPPPPPAPATTVPIADLYDIPAPPPPSPPSPADLVTPLHRDGGEFRRLTADATDRRPLAAEVDGVIGDADDASMLMKFLRDED